MDRSFLGYSQAVRHGILVPICVGSSPTTPAFVSVAQLVEHLTFNQVVAGPNPAGDIWFVSQVAKTPPFHGGIAGSIPARTILGHGLFAERFVFGRRIRS